MQNEKTIVDYYSLGLNKHMLNTIGSIKNEIIKLFDIRENLSLLSSNKKDLSNDIINILNYNVENIIKIGINNTKLSLSKKSIFKLDDKYDELVELYKFNKIKEITPYLKNNNDLEDVVNLCIFYSIQLYRHSQLFEFKLNGIKSLNMRSINACSLCEIKSRFKNDIDELIDKIHPFCNNSYYIGHDRSEIESVLSKIKIAAPELLINKKIEFIDNINTVPISSHDKNKLKYLSLNSLSNNDTLYINNETSNLEYLILSNLINFNFDEQILSWFKEDYNNKLTGKTIIKDLVIYRDPFISLNSEKGHTEYMKDSVITYISNPESLNKINKDCYEFIKTNIFNNLEFR